MSSAEAVGILIVPDLPEAEEPPATQAVPDPVANPSGVSGVPNPKDIILIDYGAAGRYEIRMDVSWVEMHPEVFTETRAVIDRMRELAEIQRDKELHSTAESADTD
ncbi:hypothetical protein [Gordonia sp. CPCC 205333]|uniref:hypothetical protein n=1 Tax=Gordonia sp. CPCC 205333 TaxID=3140790 RepID=UPI003AF409DF